MSEIGFRAKHLNVLLVICANCGFVSQHAVPVLEKDKPEAGEP